MDIDECHGMRERLIEKFEAEGKLYAEMRKKAVMKAKLLKRGKPVEFEYVVEVHTYWGEHENGVTIRSKGGLREAVSAGIREFHIENDRGDAINGYVRVSIEALGRRIDCDSEPAFSEKRVAELFEELNRDKSLWMDLYDEIPFCGTCTRLVKKKRTK